MSRGHFIGLNRHRVMLRDRIRMELYEQAIRETVREGDVVLDLGTGTGVLAMWAAQAGARRVFAVDPAPVVRLARLLAAHNDLDDRIECIEADSRAIDLPEPADVLISECMGNFFVTDEMMPVLRDAKRHCKPDARVIPRRFRLLLAPVFLPLNEDVSFWELPVGGLDLSPARTFALNSTYVRYVESRDLRGAEVELASFDFFETPDDVEGRVAFELTETAAINGFVGWFDAQLTDTVTLSTAPGQRTHWGQMIFPIEPLVAPPGSRLEAHWALHMSQSYAVRWHWSGSLIDADGSVLERFSHDTDLRYPTL